MKAAFKQGIGQYSHNSITILIMIWWSLLQKTLIWGVVERENAFLLMQLDKLCLKISIYIFLILQGG